MGWARLDDQFHSHPKVVRVGFEATGVFTVLLSYCGAYETDGRIPALWVGARCLGHEEALRRLLDAGLVARDGEDYVVPGWLDYNPPRDELEAKRDERKAKARKAANARWAKGRAARPVNPLTAAEFETLGE